MKANRLYILINIICYKTYTINAQGFSPKNLKNWEAMNVLAENIFERIKSPSGDGMVLIEDVHLYYEYLEHLLKAAENSDPKAIEFLYSLREKGGPKHLLIHPFDPEPLVNFFQWDTFAMCQFSGFLEYSWTIWRELQAFLEMKDKKQNWMSDIFYFKESV